MLLKGFKEFLLRGNVVDLAVAVVIGGASLCVLRSADRIGAGSRCRCQHVAWLRWRRHRALPPVQADWQRCRSDPRRPDSLT